MRQQPAAISSPVAALARVLDALEQELVDASNEDILEAAGDLGMKLMMKGSAAFMGLNSPSTARLTDFFDPEMLKQIRGEMQRQQPGTAHSGKDSSGK
jgi:hypothetical protein